MNEKTLKPELLAPAGNPDAAYAALHFGADAIYLGLPVFSARADAENFSPEMLSAVIAYAHALTPRRRVYLALNTLVKEAELPLLLDCLALAADYGMDAVIVQDLGVLHLARRFFQKIKLHASTQLAVHNLDGARAARALGFQRVTLARELTLPEIEKIARESGIEVEVFVHGALCCSYSGLCLFSSILLGRSGNRGRCAYLCRENFTTTSAPPAPQAHQDFPFSMKDLALATEIPALIHTGATALKIEGRKKSPLYVAMVVRLYRRLLDGPPPPPDELAALAEDVRVVFSRSWTTLFLRSPRNPEVLERQMRGHCGAAIGRVEAVQRKAGRDYLIFKTERPLELHDGLQLALPGVARPYGFAIEFLRVEKHPKQPWSSEVSAAGGTRVGIALPDDHPCLPRGTPIFCASSQAVKRAGAFPRPRPGIHRVRYPIDIALRVTAGEISAKIDAHLPAGLPESFSLQITRPYHALSAHSHPLEAEAARRVFSQIQNTCWQLSNLQLANANAKFIPLSVLKEFRRQVIKALDQYYREIREKRRAEIFRQAFPPPTKSAPAPLAEKWIIKTDQPAALATLAQNPPLEIAEVIFDIDTKNEADLRQALQQWQARVSTKQLRLALPIIMRAHDRKRLWPRLLRLLEDGWCRWEIANLGGLKLLEEAGAKSAELDLTADWPLYTLNRAAAQQLKDMGIKRLTLSPEDDRANLLALQENLPLPAVLIVYQDTPLMITETCFRRTNRCAPPHLCRFAQEIIAASDGKKFYVARKHCRSVLLHQDPLNLADSTPLPPLPFYRIDFVWRLYTPQEANAIVTAIINGNGKNIPGQRGNFLRGLL